MARRAWGLRLKRPVELWRYLVRPIAGGALPDTLDPTLPADTESTQLGASRIRNLTQDIIDLFILPSASAISFAVLDGTKGVFPVPLTNKTGAATAVGDVNVIDITNDVAAAFGDTVSTYQKVAVAQAVIANGAVGPYVCVGRTLVNTTGTVNRGDYIRKSGTAKVAESTTLSMTAGQVAPPGAIGVAMTAAAGNQITAWLFGQATPGPSTLRSYLAGLTLSNDATTPTTVFDVAVGTAADSTVAALLTLSSAWTKTTSAWVAGTGNGALDTGAIGASTTYHVFIISKGGGANPDILISLSATAPTLPAGYTLFRRIGSLLTGGASTWRRFVQDGDLFWWNETISAVDWATTNPGALVVTQALTNVPSGVPVIAIIDIGLKDNNANSWKYLTVFDPAASNFVEPAPLACLDGGYNFGANANLARVLVRTNTSAQINYKLSASDANTNVQGVAVGWYDKRGRTD